MKKLVLGIKIDDINIDQALEIVQGWLKKGGRYQIATPNPEIVVMAQKDKDLFDILNKVDLAIPDGAGLKLSGDIVCNTSGIDLMESLIKVASIQGFTIGLLGGRDKVAEKSAECLKKKYPKLKITFADSGGEVNENGEMINHTTNYPLREASILPATDLLFVAFGPPKQEKWISKNISKFPVKVAMGVGGAFDYISGIVPRAPKLVRDLGFEWLFRLIIQPWRIKRQLALIKYLWLLTKRKHSV